MSDGTTEAPTSTRDEMAAALASQEQEDKPTPSQAPPEQGTSATAQTDEAPDYFGENFDPSTLSENEQKAYASMRKAFTQKTQEVAEQRKEAETAMAVFGDLKSGDPEAQQNALGWLAQNGWLTEDVIAQVFGYEFEQEQPEEAPDPTEKLQSEWEQFKAEREAEKVKAAQDNYVQQVDNHLVSSIEAINEQLAKQGRDELTDSEQHLIVSRALATQTDHTVMPDVNAAYQEYWASIDGRVDGRLKGWASTKETTHTPAGGQAGVEAPDLDDDQARRDHMASMVDALRDRPT